METKKAKVVTTTYIKEFTGKYGVNYVHTIVMDNGDSGQYISKSNPQTKFVIGQEIDYTIETKVNGQYTNVYIKPVQEKSEGFGSRQRGGNESFALSYAKDIAVAHISKGNSYQQNNIIEMAEIFYTWLESKKK